MPKNIFLNNLQQTLSLSVCQNNDNKWPEGGGGGVTYILKEYRTLKHDDKLSGIIRRFSIPTITYPNTYSVYGQKLKLRSMYLEEI